MEGPLTTVLSTTLAQVGVYGGSQVGVDEDTFPGVFPTEDVMPTTLRTSPMLGRHDMLPIAPQITPNI